MSYSLWREAAGILETASAADADSGTVAILIDAENGVRIVDGSGWRLDALRQEYHASTAFMVERSGAGVQVCAQRENESCSFRKQNPASLLAPFSASVPKHLLQSTWPALASL